MIRQALPGAIVWLSAFAAAAQDSAPSFEETQALIERMQRQIERMSEATRQRDEALDFLESQIERAAGRLDSSEETTDALRRRAGDLSARVEDLATDRESLVETAMTQEETILALEAEVAALTSALANAQTKLDARATELAERDTEIATLQAEQARAIEALGTALAESEAGRRELLDRNRRLLGQLVSLRTVSRDERSTSADDLARAEANNQLLRAQVAQLADQLNDVGALLDDSEKAVTSQEIQIAQLNARLAEALAEQVEELSQYRSEFFGRLREILGSRQDFRIVGDRFVFQSEVLFASGSAEVGPQGQQQLQRLAGALREVAGRIPPDIGWILSVDGHTDKVPLSAASVFASNWELSTARAISVVEALIREGIPPHRLAATGFGEFQPLVEGDDESAFRRNRRIEFKLTSS